MNNNLLLSMAKPVVFAITFFLVANLPQVILAMRIGFRPVDFYLAIISINVVLAFLLGHIQHLRRSSFPYIGWYLVFLLYCVISLIVVNSSDEAVEAMIPLATQAAISLSFVLLVQRRELTRVAALAAAAATLFAAGVTVAEFLNPDFNIINDEMFGSKQEIGQIGRAGGVHSNPNANAYALVLGLFASQFFLPKFIRLPFALVVGIAVFTTNSRSGLMLWVLAIGISFFLGAYATGKVIPKILALGTAAILSILLVSGQIPVILESTGLDQYMTAGMINRLSGSFAAEDSGSNEGRMALANAAIDLFAQAPILGLGLGTSESLGYTGNGSHNMYLKFGAEMGVIGILIFVSIIGVALKTRSPIAIGFCVLFMFCNLFTHNNLEKPSLALLIPLGMFLSAAYFSQTGNGTSRKRRRRRRSRSQRTHSSS